MEAGSKESCSATGEASPDAGCMEKGSGHTVQEAVHDGEDALLMAWKATGVVLKMDVPAEQDVEKQTVLDVNQTAQDQMLQDQMKELRQDPTKEQIVAPEVMAWKPLVVEQVVVHLVTAWKLLVVALQATPWKPQVVKQVVAGQAHQTHQ